MELAFKTEIDGRPTFFVERIWESILRCGVEVKLKNFGEYIDRYPALKGYHIGQKTTKLHTIREDKTNRWREGRDIHPVINSRSPERLQFAPVIKCLLTQQIEIEYHHKSEKELIATVKIDGKQHGTAIWHHCCLVHASSRLEQLAQNDGFDDVESFFEYFDSDYTGKIIHWTNLKY